MVDGKKDLTDIGKGEGRTASEGTLEGTSSYSVLQAFFAS